MSEPIRTEKGPPPIGPYSQAIRANGYVFVSGMIPIDPQTGKLAGSDVAAQAERALQNLGAVLEAAGLGFDDVVKTTVFLLDMNDFAPMNAVYAKYFDANKPARSTVAVAGLPKGARVEIDAIAATR
ncbi:MAG TPA: RidA family protein [Candidatus Rubrimentiphilum sp.]|nr:RidA family protein [Candidatus Rubrimentiphilum sp.]